MFLRFRCPVVLSALPPPGCSRHTQPWDHSPAGLPRRAARGRRRRERPPAQPDGGLRRRRGVGPARGDQHAVLQRPRRGLQRRQHRRVRCGMWSSDPAPARRVWPRARPRRRDGGAAGRGGALPRGRAAVQRRHGGRVPGHLPARHRRRRLRPRVHARRQRRPAAPCEPGPSSARAPFFWRRGA